jgi:hypothetical protein
MPVINLNVPVPLELGSRKDNKSALLARFVVELQSLPRESQLVVHCARIFAPFTTFIQRVASSRT